MDGPSRSNTTSYLVNKGTPAIGIEIWNDNDSLRRRLAAQPNTPENKSSNEPGSGTS